MSLCSRIRQRVDDRHLQLRAGDGRLHEEELSVGAKCELVLAVTAFVGDERLYKACSLEPLGDNNRVVVDAVVSRGASLRAGRGRMPRNDRANLPRRKLERTGREDASSVLKLRTGDCTNREEE